jgi:hypothetical protein
MTRSMGWMVRALTVAGLAVPAAGCASWFMNGGTLHKGGPPPTATARFSVPSCRMLSDGSEMAGPQGQYYYLSQEARGPVLYELDGRGEGAAITNYWSDERGMHFFAWVSRSHGWVYTFPPTREELPTRWVFLGGSYQVVQGPNGANMPQGQPAASCTMSPG